MPAYAVDSSKQPMVATGMVDARFDWVEAPGGGRKMSEEQARDEAGEFLWGVEVMYQSVNYGRTASVVASITLSGRERPSVSALGPITFDNLRVEIRVSKLGVLNEYWFADSIAAPVAGSRRPGQSSAEAA